MTYRVGAALAPIIAAKASPTSDLSRLKRIAAKLKRVVIVRVFIKKTEKTLRHEIEIALKRAQEIQE